MSTRPVQTSEMSATILVVDDTPSNVRLLQAYLTSAGHQVVTATDGSSALRMLSANPCDLVLCDLVMPDMDGFEVCGAIKQAPATRNIPVVLVTAVDDDLQRARAFRAGADDFVIKPVERGMVLALVNALLRIRRLNRQLDDLEGTVVSLAGALDDRDLVGGGASERVAHWAGQLGAAIGLPESELTLLYKAAMVHDVGEVGVPPAILRKPGRLDPVEFNQVKRHTEIAEQVLGSLPRADILVPAVRHHHERVDGSGYPDGLAGEHIPLFGRIIAIADAFVALSTDRPYRTAVSRSQAMRVLLEGAGKQWDDNLVKRFQQLLREVDARPEALDVERSAG